MPPGEFMPEFLRFLRVFLRHWAALVTGSALIGLLSVAERARWFAVPGWGYVLIAACAIVLSAFRAWREEHEQVTTLAGNLADCQAAAHEVIVRDVSDELYWLLAMAQRYGMRREMLPTLYAIWIGATSISYEKSHWLYELVPLAEKQGLLKLETSPGLAVYRLPAESGLIVDTERRRKRALPPPPGALFDARSGASVEMPPPF